MLNKALGLLLLGTAAPSIAQSISSQGYTWANVKIGGGGGFVPDIVFNPSEKGLAYARTDIGGVYKLNSDDSWTPLVDFADNVHWDYWGSDALATDPVDTNRVYVAVGVSGRLSPLRSYMNNKTTRCTQILGIPIMVQYLPPPIMVNRGRQILFLSR